MIFESYRRFRAEQKMDRQQRQGVSLIQEQRLNALVNHGYSMEQDDNYTNNELLEAAKAYMLSERSLWPVTWNTPPKLKYGWKKRDYTTEERIEHLAKAGQFIAAEIDRLQRTL